MKYVVYIIKDEDGNLYKGLTKDLSRRFKEHLSGHTITTRRMNNPKIVYTEVFDCFDKARKRELYFKSAAGRRFIKKLPM